MKSRILPILIIVLCFGAFFYRFTLAEMYLSYKYPSPVEFHGLRIKVDKGFYYEKTNNALVVTSPFSNNYMLTFQKDFIPLSHTSSLEEMLLMYGHEEVIKVDKYERNGVEYLEGFSLNGAWQFEVTILFPEQNLMVNFKGMKMHYKRFKKVINNIADNIATYNHVTR